ncbi:MAG TPA: hemolysin family protein [Candidatus Saccharimonadales bacterium]|nr:hemolysin family protein [Candidatus Saccharimonadales bacterium]
MFELVLLAVSLFLVLACGLFVAAEFALIAVNRSTVEKQAATGDGRAKGVVQALTTLSTQLSSAQVGITITNLAIGFLAEPAIARLIEGPLLAAGVPAGAVPGIAIVLGITIATVVTMVFGELVPKNLAIARPLATSKFIARTLLLFTAATRPAIRALNGSANFILRRFGVEPQEELASARSADELLSLVRRSAEKGTLAKETARMLERSLNFGELTALDVMTPRMRVKAVQADETIADVLELARRSGLSRFPVYHDRSKTLDDIVGIIHIKHCLGVPRAERANTPARNIIRPPVLVPSTIELEPLLAALRRGGLQVAVVIDEFGGMDGIVTMEDVLEELVGEVHDEHDRTTPFIRKRKDGSWLISGLLRPDEIGELLGIFIPEEEEVETVGGLMIHKLERIPKVGDRSELEGVGRAGEPLVVDVNVERMDGNRIDRIRLVARPKESDENGEAEDRS